LSIDPAADATFGNGGALSTPNQWPRMKARATTQLYDRAKERLRLGSGPPQYAGPFHV
jgi:hypothetical protein